MHGPSHYHHRGGSMKTCRGPLKLGGTLLFQRPAAATPFRSLTTTPQTTSLLIRTLCRWTKVTSVGFCSKSSVERSTRIFWTTSTMLRTAGSRWLRGDHPNQAKESLPLRYELLTCDSPRISSLLYSNAS